MISKRHSEVLKKGVASLLTLAMVLGSVPMPVIAEDAIDEAGVEVAAVEDLGLVEEAAGDAAEEAALDVDGELEFVGDEAVVEDEAPAGDAVADEEAAVEEEATLEEAAPEEAAVAELGEAVEDAAEIAEDAVALGEETVAEDEAAAADVEAIELEPVDEEGLESQVTFPKLTLNNEWVSGYVEDLGTNTYQFTLKKAGRVRLEFQNWGTGGIKWVLYNESFTDTYFSNHVYNDSPGTMVIDSYLSVGTYMLQVVSPRNIYSYGYGNYEIRGKYTAAKAAERNNEKFETATTLKANTKYYATFTRNGITDHYYKISVPQSCTVVFTWDSIDKDFDPCGNLHIYDSSWQYITNYGSYGNITRELSAGTYYLKISRNDSKGGQYSLKYFMKSDTITKGAISGIKSSYVYRASAIRPNPTVKLNGTALVKDRDYTVSYGSNKNVGTGTVTVTGIGDYKGSATKTFKITKAKLSSCKVNKIGVQVWKGKACKPNPKITYKGKTLRKGTDYTLTYKRNNKVGNSTASVTIKGKGNFYGSKTLKFSIRFRDVSTSYKFYSAIQMGANKGIVSGYAKNGKPTGYFGPNDNLKRCDVAIMFWKAAGSPEPGWGGKNFRDVKRGSYYYKAVRWAASAGVVNGYTGRKNGLFGPNDKVTRQQLYYMLQNYANEVCGTSINQAAVVSQSGIPANKAKATRGEAAFMAYTAYKLSR